MSQLVTQKFRELTVGLTSVYARHKTLAGIVMTKGNYLSFPMGIFVSIKRNANINLVLGDKGCFLPHGDGQRKTMQNTKVLVATCYYQNNPTGNIVKTFDTSLDSHEFRKMIMHTLTFKNGASICKSWNQTPGYHLSHLKLIDKEVPCFSVPSKVPKTADW